MQQGEGRKKKEGEKEKHSKQLFSCISRVAFCLPPPLPDGGAKRRVIAGGDSSRGSENMRRLSLARAVIDEHY
jgi:hypothetical protein